MKYAVIVQRDCGLGDKGVIVSAHKNYDLAKAAARRSGFNAFLAVKEMPSDDDVAAAAQAMGRRGGLARSDKKTASSRINGKKGGRPKTSTRKRKVRPTL